MNKNWLVLFIAIISLATCILPSCGGSGPPGGEPASVMHAIINNTSWRAANPNAVVSDHTIDVYGTSTNGQSVHLKIFSGEKGDYHFGINHGNEARFIPNMSPGATAYSTNNNEGGSGRVSITSLDEETKTLSGNFSFKAYRLSDNTIRNAVDGQFSRVPYRFVHSSDTTSFTNIFSCVDNGANWSATKISGIRNDTVLNIIGENQPLWESINLKMPADISAGVHHIYQDDYIYAFFQKGFHTYTATNGSTTIVEHDIDEGIIKGSFFFNYLDDNNNSNSVTSGIFEIQYEIEESEEQEE